MAKNIKTIPKKNSFLNEFSVVILLIIVLFAAWTRFEGVKKETLLTFDEGVYLRLGVQLEEDLTNYSTIDYYNYLKEKKVEAVPGYLNNPLFKHPPLYPYFISMSFRIFGRNYKAARYVSFFFGILTIIIIYFIGKKAFGERRALLGALFLALDPVHWFCSEKVWIESTYVFFIYLALLLFVIGIKRNTRFLILAGVVFGLSIMGKYFAILPYIGVLIFVVFMLGNVKPKADFILFLLMPVLVSLPWFIWNYNAYGGNIFFNMIRSQQHFYTDFSQKYLTRYTLIAAAVFTLFSALILSRIMFDNVLSSSKSAVERIVKNNLFKKALTFAALLICVYIFANAFKVNRLALSYLPIDGNELNFFKNEPRIFYIKRLLELSPVYLFGVLSLLFVSRWNKYNFLFLMTLLPTIIFFSYFSAYETRYVLAAIPALCMLSSDGVIRLYDALKESPNLFVKHLRFALIVFLIYLFFKVIQFDFSVIINNPTMFML